MLDELGVNATASATMQVVDGWLLRASTDLPFRRCNCAIPLRDAGPLPLDVIEAFYASRTQPPRIQVTTAASAEIDEQLAARGYVIEAPVDILVARTATVATRTRTASDVSTETTTTLDDLWAETYATLHDGDDRVRAYGRMLKSIGPIARAITATVDGQPAGMGFGVVERGWCGLYGMTTLATFRRRGVGSTVLHALAAEVADLGAADMYLQMERDNDRARGLYEHAGYAYEYGYHYRTRG